MHVLAVSGLHIGIIFWLIILFLGFLRRQKTGRPIFTIISILLLWGYAFITGLSPSVTRATAMFSIFILGETLQRKSSVYNSLAASAFFLLLFNPNNLYETGFLLSYSAVFGIIFLQPKISSIIKVKNKIPQFFWDLFTVSLAAQIATTPLTLYYFNQFPTYFWITNIFIIPAVMALIPLGIFLLFISGIPLLTYFIATIIDLIIKFIFYMLGHIEQLPFSVIHIFISQIQLVIIIILLSSFLMLLMTKRTLYLHLTLTGILFLITTFIYYNINNLNKNELIIYSNSENATLQLIHRKSNFVISEKDIKPNDQIQISVARTTQTRELLQPLFFTVYDTAISRELFLENGIIYFEGKTILFEGNQRQFSKFIHPDIIINPVEMKGIDLNKEKEEIIITNKRFIPEENNIKKPFQYTTFETAFRKIW